MRIIMAAVLAMTTLPALSQDAAQNAAQEKLSRACNAIYAKLCKGVRPGPELVGQCADKYPDVMEKIPQKCVSDFQTNVENYHEAKGQK